MSGNTERDKAEPLPQNRGKWWMADVFIQLPYNTDEDKGSSVNTPVGRNRETVPVPVCVAAAWLQRPGKGDLWAKTKHA